MKMKENQEVLNIKTIRSSEKITSSKFHLVDLAGSERLKKTNSEGGTLREAGFINKSLTFLEQVSIELNACRFYFDLHVDQVVRVTCSEL